LLSTLFYLTYVLMEHSQQGTKFALWTLSNTTVTNQQMCTWTHMPNDIVVHVITPFLLMRDVKAMRSTSRSALTRFELTGMTDLRHVCGSVACMNRAFLHTTVDPFIEYTPIPTVKYLWCLGVNVFAGMCMFPLYLPFCRIIWTMFTHHDDLILQRDVTSFVAVTRRVGGYTMAPPMMWCGCMEGMNSRSDYRAVDCTHNKRYMQTISDGCISCILDTADDSCRASLSLLPDSFFVQLYLGIITITYGMCSLCSGLMGAMTRPV
jgi:hypothetical protein